MYSLHSKSYSPADREKRSLLTIVTVVLNAAPALERTIKSVIAQTEKVEYIIIDGASNDGTQNVIKKYEQHIAYWISESDRGIYDAMNKGIEIATGNYLNFLNAGDVLMSNNVCEAFANTPKKKDDSVYLLGVRRDDGRVIAPKFPRVVRYYKLPTYHQGIIYPREILKKYPYPTNYKMVGDYCQYFKATKTTSVKVLPLIWCHYDTTGVSSTNKKSLHLEFAQAYQDLGISRILTILRMLRGWIGV